jgi:dCMP deaminase
MSRESGKSWEKCRAVHAELNAILNAAKNGVSTDGCRMYLSTTPCVFCSRTLINAGVKEVYAMSKYSHDEAIALLNEGGIKVRVVSPVELTDLVRFT